jgi:3-oxoacyl-[acyl-carrier protein] reductase
MPWGRHGDDPATVAAALAERGARTVAVAADLVDVRSPAAVFDAVTTELGPVTALVMCHAESVDSSLLDTTVDSFDRHYAVNVRATWLLLKEYAGRFPADRTGRGRVVALTSDHVVHNLPYGATKGALDRIVLAAARELQHLRLTANVVNPGPVDTGWLDDALRQRILDETPLGRGGTPRDTAALVSFLLSPQGGWVNGQLLHSDGGLHA